MRSSTLLIAVSVSATVLSLVVTTAPSAKKKPKPVPCSGRYLVTQGAAVIVGDSAPQPAVVAVQGKQVSLGAHCGPVGGVVKAGKKGTSVAAGFKSCGASLQKVKLKASISSDCRTMTGVVKAKKLKPAQKFVATVSHCGDGVVDGGLPEACDGTTGCNPDETCKDDCSACVTNTHPVLSGVCTSSGAACGERKDCPVQPTPDHPTGEGCCGDGVVDGAAFGETCDLGKDTNCAGLPCASGCTAQCKSVGACTVGSAQCVSNGDCGGQGTCCGNHFVDPGETCDDGNAVETDGCPASCHVETCSPSASTLATSVTYTGPAGVTIAGLTVFLDYPEGKVNAPTFSVVFGVGNVTNDLGYGVTATPIKVSGLPTVFIKPTYKTCTGAPAATPADFKCTVTDASDDGGNVVPADQVTCAVTIP
jgi:cysteine-rich repeat protein